jgi:CRISPR-associated protein (TIGR02710 family)
VTANPDPAVILILTVGGSEAPLRRAIEETDPSGLLLIASGGEHGQTSSAPAAQDMATAFQGGRPERFSILVTVPADDPDVGFSRIIAAIEETTRQRPGHRLIANYTGGTKSMSAALLMAAFHRRIEVQITTGVRTDLTKVVSGTESARALDTRLMGVETDLASALKLAERADYAGASFLLTTLQNEIKRKRFYPTKGLRRRLESSLRYCDCLAAWDIFDHRTAHRQLESAHDMGEAWAEALEASGHRRLLNDIIQGDKNPSVGLCADLLANALRRRDQHRFDDALARLYRFTEACAQTQLFRRWGLRADALSDDNLPDELKGRSTPVYDAALKAYVHRIGLHQTMRLLRHKDPSDSVADAYFKGGDHGPRWLNARNKSIMAHGYQIIGKEVVDAALAWIDANLIPAMDLRRSAPFPTQPFARVP